MLPTEPALKCVIMTHFNAQLDLHGLISLFMNPINVWSVKLKENTNLTVLTMFE